MSASKQKPFDGLSVEDFRGKGNADERRRENRVSLQRTISVLPCDQPNDDGFVPVQLFDCSIHGIGMIYSREMAVGERFLVKLKMERVLLAVYIARHCRAVEQSFQIGAELTGFVGGINDDANQLFEAMLKG